MLSSTDSAAATGLPVSGPLGRIPAGARANIIPVAEIPRRVFLSQLMKLPLIGGGLSVIGAPHAVAEPVTAELLEAYKTWLYFEHRFLTWEMAQRTDIAKLYGFDEREKTQILRNKAVQSQHAYVGDTGRYHNLYPVPSVRAALVMSTVGCDWKGDWPNV